MIATGNADKARVLIKGSFGIRFRVVETPMQAGPMAGITSVWPVNEKTFYIAGGDLNDASSNEDRLWHYQNEEFIALSEPPINGALYSLSLIDHNGSWLLTSNPQGAAALNLDNNEWFKLSDSNIWNIQCHDDISCWLVGKGGYVGRLQWQAPQERTKL